MNNAGALIENCQINNNNTTNYDGAGLYLNNSFAELMNCLFFWNSAARFGGAITTVSSSLYAHNCTVYENGGGTNQFQHSTSGIIQYNHSIFDNVNDYPGLDLATSGTASVTFNECLISPDLYFPATKNSCVTGHASFTNAGTNDYTQTTSSPGVDMPISLVSLNTTTEDIAGNPRIIGSYMDLGAFELCNLQATASQSGNQLTADQANADYQWINCTTGQNIINANNQSYTATSNGDYAVIVSYGGGCVDTSACLTVTGLSVDENDLQFFSVYPNPTNEMLNLSTSENINQVIISTLGGQRVIMSHEKSIYVGDLDNGVYMITVFTDSKRSTKRFVKQ